MDKNAHSPYRIGATFVVLCFILSSPIWYLYAHLPAGSDPSAYTMGVMWCPAIAALSTRFWFQRNLRGFGMRFGQLRWLLLALILPALSGLAMFGSAWFLRVAQLDISKLQLVFRPSFILMFIVGLLFNCFGAFGEELGWRGLLVPELSRSVSYTKLAFVSGVVWTVWHLPLVIFGSYHGFGPLWFSLATFVPLVMAASFVYAWMRLVSGSVWVTVLLHGSWNYFIQGLYPTITIQSAEGERMLGEFGWLAPLVSLIFAAVFWCFRDHVPVIDRDAKPA